MFNRYAIVRRAPRRKLRARPGSRRCLPAVDGLEARALLHVGPVAAVVRPAESTPVIPTVTIRAALAETYAGGSTSGLTVQTRDGSIFLPPGLVPGRSYPLVVAFAYNADPGVPLGVWKTQARENHWIVYASRDYQNSVLHGGLATSVAVADRVKAQVDALSDVLPVDRSRIIFTGFSGAANYADFMNLRYPGYAAAVIINSGRIPDQLFREAPTRGYLTVPSASDFAGSRREAVFLASPTDPDFYGISQANARTMQKLGWSTLFLSFPGGHNNAPASVYRRAIAWIMAQPSWTATP